MNDYHHPLTYLLAIINTPRPQMGKRGTDMPSYLSKFTTSTGQVGGLGSRELGREDQIDRPTLSDPEWKRIQEEEEEEETRSPSKWPCGCQRGP